jgi:hypothetical protein
VLQVPMEKLCRNIKKYYKNMYCLCYKSSYSGFKVRLWLVYWLMFLGCSCFQSHNTQCLSSFI